MITPDNLNIIAKIIREDWKGIFWAAKPYLAAMECMESINEDFAGIPGRVIVQKFLCYAGQWQSEAATAVKRHLQRLLKDSNNEHS